MALSYFLRVSLYSACTSWSGQFLYLLAFLPSLFVLFLSSLSSLAHQCFDFEQISDMGTILAIVSCNAVVSLSHSQSRTACDLILLGTPKSAILPSSASRNSQPTPGGRPETPHHN